jgi:tetratricopeptide (TPR) repeat protein
LAKTDRSALVNPVVLIRTLCVVVLLAAACSRESAVETPPRAGIAWSASVEEARLEAQKTGDRVLLSFEAYWCPWSRLMRESLYVDPAVVESLASFRCVAVDADRDSGLCTEHDVTVFPTVIVTDTYGVEMARVVGYLPPAEFLRRLSSAKQTDQALAEMFRSEQRRGDDPEFLIHFADLLRNMGTCDAALMRYEKAAEISRGIRNDLYEEATYAIAECSMLAGQYRSAAERFRSFLASNPGSARCEDAMVLAALCSKQAGDVTRAIDALESYLRTYPAGVYAEPARKEIEEIRARRGSGR